MRASSRRAASASEAPGGSAASRGDGAGARSRCTRAVVGCFDQEVAKVGGGPVRSRRSTMICAFSNVLAERAEVRVGEPDVVQAAFDQQLEVVAMRAARTDTSWCRSRPCPTRRTNSGRDNPGWSRRRRAGSAACRRRHAARSPRAPRESGPARWRGAGSGSGDGAAASRKARPATPGHSSRGAAVEQLREGHFAFAQHHDVDAVAVEEVLRPLYVGTPRRPPAVPVPRSSPAARRPETRRRSRCSS